VTSSTVGFSSSVETVEVGMEAKEVMELTSTAIMANLCWTGLMRLVLSKECDGR